MTVREIKDTEKSQYNKVVGHVIQSWEWGEFRKKMGLPLVRFGHFDGKKLLCAYQLTLHYVPILNTFVGYLPKTPLPDKNMVRALRDFAKKNNVSYIKIEPNELASKSSKVKIEKLGLIKSKKSLFTKFNFLIDLNRSEEEIMASLNQKTRYNVRLAVKRGVEVYDSTDEADFEIYLKLYFETTNRQKYFGHTPEYHRRLWETLKPAGKTRLLVAKYKGKPLVTWMLFNFDDTLYYPYGGSSVEHKEVMASNLVAWEAIRLGKKLGLKTLDLWGALTPDVDVSDKWYGFHKFKMGYGPKHVEYVGTYDLVLKPRLYKLINIGDKVRWAILKATRR